MARPPSIGIDKYKPKPVKPPKTPGPPRTPAGLGRRKTPAQVTREPIRMYGPRILKRFAELVVVNDWSVPPPGFLGSHKGTISADEWMVYAALALVKNDPPNPRQPPFTGGVTWQYQAPLGGGRLTRGGQVCDFLIAASQYSSPICIRLQTAWHDLLATPQKIQKDLYLKTHSQGIKVIDINSKDFVWDKTLRAACRIVANALSGRESYSPALFGTSSRVKR